jgi:hypothetical protein
MPNRQLARAGGVAAQNAYLIDTDKVGIGMYRDVFEDRPSKTGDAEKRVLLCEYALIMKNEAAHASSPASSASTQPLKPTSQT